MSNPFAALLPVSIDVADVQNAKLCVIIEDSFGFTLSKEASAKRRLVFLEDQAQAFPGRQLDIEVLEHALFERLFLQNPAEFVLSHKKDLYSDFYETKVITYLFNCFKRTEQLTEDLRFSLNNLIVRNVLTSLKQPDLYFNQQLFAQFYEILKDLQVYSERFFNEVYQGFLTDEDGVEGMKEPYTQLLKDIHIDVAKSSILNTNPVIFDILKLYTNNEHLSVIFMDYCQPKKPDVGIEYANTLLGALFSISILPKTLNGTYDFFQNPLDQTSNSSTENLLFASMDKVTQNINFLILSLLKSTSMVKSKMLTWLGGCLKANEDRGKLWNAQVPEFNQANYATVGDGFMINMGCILIRLCQPFCTPQNRNKVLKVDPTYCAVPEEQCAAKGVHLLDMFKETCLIPLSDSDDSGTMEERPTAASYNFVTECFFMGHRALDLGYRVSVDKLVRLNQDMARIERAYNDAVSQASGMTDLVDTMKQRMTSELAKYLSIKANLSEPALMEMIFNCMSSTSYWLSQVAMHADFNDNAQSYASMSAKEIVFPLGRKIPVTLKCIPEFVVENVVCFLVFLRRFNPKVFEIQGYDQLQHILSFILIYMGSAQHMKNPHLRARLAEALEALLPFHKDEPAGLNTLGGYQRERLFTTHVHRREIVRSLLDVFVGIEMTGQSVQFEQKFNYRRPMYLVMDYLWELPEHQQYFQRLAVEAEQNMEAVSPPLFLRFVNLLMNDAVFLLDESLSNMSKLKEMQIARENGEWERISPTERAQNMGYMQQTGLLARFDNILGRDTIKTLEKLTSKITTVFTHSTMVDRVAAMLNYFLLNLVGPNQKNFKVKDQKEYSFDPAVTVLDICKIYVNLKESEAFCLATSQDGRSYSPQLFALAEDVLVRIGGGALVGELQEVASRVSEKAVEYHASEEITAEAPEHFLDPIMNTIMFDPVLLPSSKQIVDRTTIARHLLSDQTDPFNRSPLTMDQIVPDKELAEEIRRWVEERKKK